MEEAVSLDIMLHAYLFMQSGIPVLYSGDEIGQVNDYTYKEDPSKAADSRYLHRGAFIWENAEKKSDKKTVEGRIFKALGALEAIRKENKAFGVGARVITRDTGDRSVLCIERSFEGKSIIGIFNFSEEEKAAHIEGLQGEYRDMLTSKKVELPDIMMPGYGFFYIEA